MNTDGKAARVQRYWSGRAPQFAKEEEESSSDDEQIVFRKPQSQVKLPPPPPPVSQSPMNDAPEATSLSTVMDRRLQRLAAARNAESSSEEGGEEEEFHSHRRRRHPRESTESIHHIEPTLPSSASESKRSEENENDDDDDVLDRRNRLLLKAKLLATQRIEEFPSEVSVKPLPSSPPRRIDNLIPARYQTAESSDHDSSDNEGDDNEEEEEDDEEEPMILFKPTFVKKQERETIAERERQELEAELVEEKRQNLLEQRRLESHNMVAESVRKEILGLDKDLAERGLDNFHDIDDTDGLDPEAEYHEWKLRELRRIKRDKEQREKWLREQEVIEHRRLMTDEERRQDEMSAGIDRFHKEKKTQGFMQRYYHKGAFYQDQEILQRDFTAPTTDEVRHKEALPSVMQVRGTEFGRTGRSKWTHLANEDTTDKTAAWSQKTDSFKRTLGKMGGMKSDFDRPTAASKRHRKD